MNWKVRDQLIPQKYYQQPEIADLEELKDLTQLRFKSSQYNPVDTVVVRGKIRHIKGEVICLLDFGGFTFEGQSMCSHLDEWKEEEGKKIAFERALDKWTRHVRGRMWELFFEGEEKNG